jgi:hypothetical protein
MKTQPQPSARKLVSGYDKQLKYMLIEDLKSFKIKSKLIYSNHQAQAQVSLSVV